MFSTSVIVKAALLGLAAIFITAVYRVRLHRLRHIPGPDLAKISNLFLHVICYLGIEGRVLRNYHLKYGKVVRVGPNSVSISDADAIREIYVSKGGFHEDGGGKHGLRMIWYDDSAGCECETSSGAAILPVNYYISYILVPFFFVKVALIRRKSGGSIS